MAAELSVASVGVHHVVGTFTIRQIYADTVFYVATLDAPSC